MDHYYQGDQSDSDLQWTPTLSTHESAKAGDEEECIEYGEHHLHTNSPAWAALFPLPDSPEASGATVKPTSPQSDWDNDLEAETGRGQNLGSLHSSLNNTTSQEVPVVGKEDSPSRRMSIYSDICYTPSEAR